MSYEFNFGKVTRAPSKPAKGGASFRIAVLGDFSGRANSGELETGDQLAGRKPHKVDVDNIDDVIERMGIELHLPIGKDGGTVEVCIGCMDDFHPDELHDNLEIFSELSSLRLRLGNNKTFDSAAKEVQSWLGDEAIKKHSRRKEKARGSAIPTNGKLSDFAKLIGAPTAKEETAVDELLHQVVAPFVQPASDPKQDAMIAAVDEALSGAMRSVLHHPDFQSMESLWRSVDLLTRNLETGTNLRITLYDITAEEVAADLSSSDDLEETGLYKLLVELPALEAQPGPVSAIVGCYTFEQTPPHAELLGRLAKIAAAAQAPFIASIGPDCLQKVDPDDVHPLITESWSTLKNLPEAAYVALTVPRFMLRLPYGKKSDPIDPFEFEEFTAHTGLSSMLWGNSAVIAGLLLGQTFQESGMKKMKLGSIMSIGDMPFHYYTDPDGDQVALPCTDRLISVKLAEHVTSQRFIPVLSIKGRNEVRLGSFQSLAASQLAGPWAVAETTSAPAAEEEPAAAESFQDAGSSDSGDEDVGALAAESESGDSDSSGDDDLDALLADLDSGDDTSDTSDDSDGDDDEMDPELAALLADL